MLVLTYSRVQVILLLPVMPVFKTLHKKRHCLHFTFFYFLKSQHSETDESVSLRPVCSAAQILGQLKFCLSK